MLMVPYRADVAMPRWPYANWAIILACVVVFILTFGEVLPEETVKAMVLNGWGWSGLLGHLWLHGGVFHLAGNMIFLWVFGNAVCAKVGNIAFPFIYVGLGLVAGAADQLASPGPAIGASGAINGIVGMFLVFYPLNDVSIFYLLVYKVGLYTLSSGVVIFIWLLFDIWGLVWGGSSIGYAAHLGGFLAGILLAIFLLKTRLVLPDAGERTIFDLFGRKRVYPMAGRLREAEEMDLARPYEQPAELTEPVEAATLLEMNPAQITFQCSCGKTLKVLRRYAGRHMRCPACRKMLSVPS